MTDVAIEIHANKFPGVTCAGYVAIDVGVQVGKETRDAVPGDSRSAVWRIPAQLTDDNDWR